MSAESELMDLYNRWRALSNMEGEAILACDWVQLAEAQNEKRLLQDHAVALSERLRCEHSADEAQAAQNRLQALVADLVCIEKKNGEMLAKQRRAVEGKNQELRRAGLHLRQIHGAYAPGADAAWNCYS
ncbi:MAG TPA: hypothetical protein VGE41_07600 [Verrucomicrobiae bacterium]|jgi:hypothetical protein